MVVFNGPWYSNFEMRKMCVDMTLARYTMPPELPLGTLFGEGGGTQITERWGELTWRAHDLFIVGERDGWHSWGDMGGFEGTAYDELGRVIKSVRSTRYREDFSWGPCHISYQNIPVRDGSYSQENMSLCRAWCFDPENSLPWMLDKLQYYWDRGYGVMGSMFMYNSPGNNGQPADYQGDGGASIRNNYTRGLASAKAWLAANGY